MINTEKIDAISNEIFDYLLNYATTVLSTDYTYKHSVIPQLKLDNKVVITVEDRFVDMRDRSSVMNYRQEVSDFVNELIYHVGITGLIALRDFVSDPSKFIADTSIARFDGLKFSYPKRINITSGINPEYA